MQPDVEHVSVDHDDLERRRVVDRCHDARRCVALTFDRRVPAFADTPSQLRVTVRDQHRNLDVAVELIGKSQHPLEVPEFTPRPQSAASNARGVTR